jgi:polar amino acid transport system ATP-binding protein
MVGEVLEVMRGPGEERPTMLEVTHEMAFARDVATKVVFMDAGLIVERTRRRRCSPSRSGSAPGSSLPACL